MTYFTYIIQSQKNGNYYIGQTNNLNKRLADHNSGYSNYTKKFVPWNLYAYKEFESRKDAMDFERKLKNLKSRNRILLFIEKHQFVQVTNE